MIRMNSMNSDYEAVTQTRVTQSEICWDEDLDIFTINANLPIKNSCLVYLRGLWQLIWHLLFNKRNYKLYLEQSFSVCKVYTSENTGLTKRINPWQPEVVFRFFGKRGGSLSSFSFLLKNIKYDIDLIIDLFLVYLKNVYLFHL